jgi:2-polyprenyl-6-methoxyphenol hydroxylase-like FAD-dependent oxidoreductase
VLCLERYDLSRVLMQRCEELGVEVRTGAQCAVTAVTELEVEGGDRTDSGGATVTLADGSEVAADVVVGADGIHSMVRAAITNGRVKPVHCGYEAPLPSKCS